MRSRVVARVCRRRCALLAQRLRPLCGIVFALGILTLSLSGCAGVTASPAGSGAEVTLDVSTSSLPNATIGTAYSATLLDAGGKAPYSWSISSGNLPSGLTLNGSSGVISGDPTVSGSFAFTIQTNDSSSPVQIASKSLTIAVTAAALTISTASLPEGTVGAQYSAALQASGGTVPYTWSIISGSLPSGLALNANGQISGSPSTQGTSSFSAKVQDSSAPANTASDSYEIVVSPTTSENAAGCGATAGGASQYDQSACGNVAPFPSPAAGAAISACQNISAGTFHLTSNIGSSQTAVCLKITGGPVVLDLAGFTVTGRIVGSSFKLSGTHIYSSAPGGGVICSDTSGTDPGCIYLQGSDTTITAVLEVDHLTIVNNDSSGANSARNLMIDWGSTPSQLGTAVSAKIHNITSTSATGPSSARIVNVQLQSDFAYPEFSYNRITCLSQAGSCQGIVSYDNANNLFHNNFLSNQLSQINGATSDTARAVTCDGDTPGTGRGGGGCQIYNNYIEAEDGRAFRLRNVNSTPNTSSIHDNLVDDIVSGSSGAYIAAVHLCDPDSGQNDASAWSVYTNTFNVSDGGTILMARNCTGFPQFSGNTINGTQWTGLLADLRAIDGLSATLTLLNNSGVTTTAKPQSNVEAGATLQLCDSGTAGGAGVITAVTCAGP